MPTTPHRTTTAPQDEVERYLVERLTAAQLDDELLAARRAGHARIPRVPNGCDAQGRHPQAAEACTELGAAEARNDVSLYRAWMQFLAGVLPPGTSPRRLLRGAAGAFWVVMACLLVWGGIVLAASVLPISWPWQ